MASHILDFSKTADMRGIVQRRRAAGRSISLIEFAPHDEPAFAPAGLGCDYHPTAATHRRMAESLVASIRAAKRW